MFVVVKKGEWAVQEPLIEPETVEDIVARIVRQHPTIKGERSIVTVFGEGREPKVTPLSDFTGGDPIATTDETALHQEAGEAGD